MILSMKKLLKKFEISRYYYLFSLFKNMADYMDTSMDTPSFDAQSIHLSYEERRWLWIQKTIHKLDQTLQTVVDLHKTIRDYQKLSAVLSTISSSSIIPKPVIDDKFQLYYSSTINGNNSQHIDEFRLHHQQLFQSTFSDISSNPNYYLFIILVEGIIFYSSEIAKDYTASMINEMRKFLSTFHIYIRKRTTKLIDVISFISKTSLPSYTIVHTAQGSNVGVLFQHCPKIEYYLNSSMPFNSILATSEYSTYSISPEELRYSDYSLNVKCQNHVTGGLSTSLHVSQTPLGINGLRLRTSISFPTLHSSPIVYPHTEDMIYRQTYPSFWSVDFNLNENNDALFHSTSLDKSTPEYLFVERTFHRTLSDKENQIIAIERIQNLHLWEKFRSHRGYMRRKNGQDNINEDWLFHGTNSDNHHRIISHGFNRSYCRENVFYGRGVYFSRFAAYSKSYGDRQDVSYLFLCRVLVGYHTYGEKNMQFPPQITLSKGTQIQADSTTDHQKPYGIVCTFHDDQNYPEYIITYMDKK
ncbi:hypothetical protein I4U23_008161 [Adineta vaga]|nr:hypothetical protein I4U23_008161 [Adineta vaga]